jgi:hypothetical protein
VLRQQGHFYDVACAAYSPDGALIATGADDAKVSGGLWGVQAPPPLGFTLGVKNNNKKGSEPVKRRLCGYTVLLAGNPTVAYLGLSRVCVNTTCNRTD